MTAPAAPAAEPTPLQVALRHRWWILAFAALAAAAMAAALRLVPPSYLAEADVRIDMPQLRVVADNASVLHTEAPTLELVHTEMAALNSPKLALAAVQALGLAALPEYQDCPPPPWPVAVGRLAARLRGAAPPPEPLPGCRIAPEHAAKVLLGKLAFGTDRASFIMQISAAASDAALAARIANGYAEAYVAWQRDLKARLAAAADEWLAAELAAMQGKMLAADAAVEGYRQQHHLIGLHGAAGSAGAAGGTDTLARQRLDQRNTELGGIDAALAEKSGMLGEVQRALAAGRLEAVAPVVNAPLIQSLVAREAELAGNLAELRASDGTAHPAAVAAAAALARASAEVRGEAEKIARSLAGEVAALTARRGAVAAEVAALERTVAGESEADVGLAELERAAATDRTIYESLFVRLKQVDAERRMEQGNAAVVVEASPPDFPVFPRPRLMVAGSFLAALGIGAGLALGREMMSRRFRDAEQAEGEVGLPVIGLFAKCRRAPQDVVIDQPLSIEAEAMHGVLTQLIGRAQPGGAPLGRVVMVTSALPGEGKSCLTVALGRAAMRAGMFAFVLDCDLRRPAVARLLAGGAPAGAPPAEGGGEATELMRRAQVDARSGLGHLSLGEHIANPHGLTAWRGLAAAVEHLRARYDLVLLDTPPVLAVADALKLGGLAEAVVLTIDWHGTPRQAVAAAVRALQRVQAPVTGLVMSKVDLRRYARANGANGIYLRPYPGGPS
jgi:polysaccharide biosynthesis transport protein